MANIKISELNELTEKANNDYVPIVDTSADETKKISVENLVPNIENTYSESTENVYNCDYSNKVFGGTLLWTNPSPTSQFLEQTVSVNLTNYDFYEVIYMSATTDNNVQNSGKIPKGYGTVLSYGIGNATNGPYNEFRTITASSNSGVTFSLGIEAYASTREINNTKCVPLYIIGYKTNLFN